MSGSEIGDQTLTTNTSQAKGAMKMQDNTLQDRTMTDKLAGQDIAGQDNDGQTSRA